MMKMFETVPAGVVVLEKEAPYKILYVNGSYHELIGMSGEELGVNSNLSQLKEELIFPDDYSVVDNAMQEARELENSKEYVFRMKKVDGNYQWHALHIAYLAHAEFDGFVYILSMWNVQRYIQVADEIKELEDKAKRDALTGLWNKLATKEKMEEYLRSEPEQQHALLMIDVDDFKYVNDNFGHAFGDAVIKSVAEGIESVFRKEDIIGRVGGDEFLVLMKQAEYAKVIEKVEDLCRRLRKRYCGEREEVIISCSVGISFFDRDGDNYEALFIKADKAMYQAKDAGKNQYRVYEEECEGTESDKYPGRNQLGEVKQIKAQDENFLSEAFFLLSRTKDINGSLNLLLERIGRRYDLEAVIIFKDLPERDELVSTNCWKRGIGSIAESGFVGKYQEWGDFFFQGYDESGMRCIEGQRFEKGYLEPCNIVNCRFVSQSNRKGVISFCSRGTNRQWKEYEKETFLEIANIISVFVSLRHNQIENLETIRSLRSRDPLTGLLNETAFKEIVQQKINDMNPNLQYAMIYTDIREFSYVNENFGNEAGNKILKEFAIAVSSAPKVLSCRLHSDLFVTLVWDDSKENIVNTVEWTVKHFSEEQQKNYPQGNLHLVAGIYFIEPEDDVDTVIENANLTRKQIKGNTSGSVCQVYNDELRVRRETEKRIYSQFKETLEEERLLVYVQPKFLLNTMELSGGEALVRWQKKDGSMEFPGDFIPVLERSGDIVELDFYVFEKVLKYLRRWKEQGKKLCPISVNFSRKHFEGNGIYERVCQLREQYGVEAKYVEIEITESLLVSGLDKVRTEMALLRENGFTVAIDDFGTGYSSLSMLHDMPADIVKIDRSFLNKNNIEQEREFIEKIGALIRSVKEEVLFEGIETEQQLAFLVDCGFHYGQGYLYDRPLPVEVFEEKYIK